MSGKIFYIFNCFKEEKIKDYQAKYDQIENKLDNNIVVSAHGNSIRSMCKFLFELDNNEVTKLEIPTGNPLKITFNNEKKLTDAIYLDRGRANNLIKF